MSKASETLAKLIRRDVIQQIYRAGSGHPGGSLSCADILAVLYADRLQLSGDDPDTFILSKGHACPALYAVWAHMGIISMETLQGLRKLGSPLQGLPHPTSLPQTIVSTGSLGQGFSTAVGMALGKRYQHKKGHVFAVLGDGEMQAGIVWEAAMCAAHYQLENITAIIDYNKLQSDAPNDAIMRLEPLADKWKAFGWQVQEVDGHDHSALYDLLNHSHPKMPIVIIAHTLKGKGVSWMEGVPAWHGSVKLSEAQTESAMEAIG